MSDDHDDPVFESADAGASHTYPMQAGSIRKGGHCMLKGFPCKISDVATSKTGKHGHAKCNFTGNDIFTGKKYEDMCPASHNMDVPNVTRAEYQLLDINMDDGTISLLTDSGDTKDDLNLPAGTDGQYEEICDQISTAFNDGKDLKIIVLMACGKEKVVEMRELK